MLRSDWQSLSKKIPRNTIPLLIVHLLSGTELSFSFLHLRGWENTCWLRDCHNIPETLWLLVALNLEAVGGRKRGGEGGLHLYK